MRDRRRESCWTNGELETRQREIVDIEKDCKQKRDSERERVRERKKEKDRVRETHTERRIDGPLMKHRVKQWRDTRGAEK